MSNIKRYYWLRLQTDFFENKLIKKLRRLPGGDSLLVIYLKMLLISVKNEGVIQIDGIEEDTPEELSLMIDEPIENIQLLLGYCFKSGLIAKLENMEDLEMLQTKGLIGCETAAAERMRQLRNRQKNSLECNNVTQPLRKCSKQLHNRYVEIEKEIDIEIEKEIDIEIEKEIDTTTVVATNKSKKENSAAVIFKEYEKCGFGLVSSDIIAENIKSDIDSYSKEWVLKAMEIAVLNGVRKWNYVRGILKDWDTHSNKGSKPWEVERHGKIKQNTIKDDHGDTTNWENLGSGF